MLEPLRASTRPAHPPRLTQPPAHPPRLTQRPAHPPRLTQPPAHSPRLTQRPASPPRLLLAWAGLEADALKPWKTDISAKIDAALADLEEAEGAKGEAGEGGAAGGGAAGTSGSMTEAERRQAAAERGAARKAAARPRVLTLGSDTEMLRREGQRLEAKFAKDSGNGWAYNHALGKLRMVCCAKQQHTRAWLQDTRAWLRHTRAWQQHTRAWQQHTRTCAWQQHTRHNTDISPERCCSESPLSLRRAVHGSLSRARSTRRSFSARSLERRPTRRLYGN